MASERTSDVTELLGRIPEIFAKASQPFRDLCFLSLCKTYIVQFLDYFLQVGTEVWSVLSVEALQLREPCLEMFQSPRIDVDLLEIVPEAVCHVFDEGSGGGGLFGDAGQPGVMNLGVMKGTFDCRKKGEDGCFGLVQ